MSTAAGAGQLATQSTPEGAVRRSAGAVRDAVEHVRAINGRLESIKARVQGIHSEKATQDEAPEPVRNDLEELEYQISILHGELNLTGNHLDDVNGI